jgi:hypothetical protein
MINEINFYNLLKLYLKILEVDLHISTPTDILTQSKFIPENITKEVENSPYKYRIIHQYINFFITPKEINKIELSSLRIYLKSPKRTPIKKE